MKTTTPAIEVRNISKTFHIHNKNNSIKGKILAGFRGEKTYRDFTPLDNISFRIEKGEFFGIVGRNGSGKSTLLKTIAGIYSPDKGSVKINGRLVPFIELGVGFNPELTGRENIYLNGALLGFSRQEIAKMYDEIVDFAELEPFIEEKLKNYSSGMQVRLAFSIAIKAKGDILLLDEVLAVGDSAFQQKCLSYFNTIKKQKQTVILVSHSMASIERFCDRAMLIDNGKIIEVGKSSRIAELYEGLFIDDMNKKVDHDSSGKNSNLEVSIQVSQDDKEAQAVVSGKPIQIKATIRARHEIKEGNIGINIRDDKDQVVFSTNTLRTNGFIRIAEGKPLSVSFDIDNYYTNGEYSVDIHVVEESDSSHGGVLYKKKALKSFRVSGVLDHVHSMFHPEYKITVTRDD